MKNRLLKMIKTFLFLSSLTLLLTSCAKNPIIDTISDGLTDANKAFNSKKFHSLTDMMVNESEAKFRKYLAVDDTVLVSDFVNLDKLKNRSKLGFLLSDHLKNSLLKKDIIVRQVELGEEFQFGLHGFNLLTRIQKDMSKKYVESKYAIVGTYSITTQSLIVFIKLIDITNGNILSSASASTSITDEIMNLEYEKVKEKSYIRTPMVL